MLSPFLREKSPVGRAHIASYMSGARLMGLGSNLCLLRYKSLRTMSPGMYRN